MHSFIWRVCAVTAAGVLLSAAGVTGASASGGALRAARMSSGMMTHAPAGAGAQLWAGRYAGAGNSTDVARSVAVSPAGGTVFVTGYSGKTLSSYDYATVAYNAATGAQLWVKRYNGPGNGLDKASSAAVSPGGGMVFVTGWSAGAGSGEDYATVAYNAATGAQLWVERYAGPGSNSQAGSVAVSPSGKTVFVTGASAGAGSGDDYATVAYNAATGAQLWVKRYAGPGNNSQATSVAVSPTGTTVFVTGQSASTATAWDSATVAYNAATGAQLWVKRYTGTGHLAGAFSTAVSPAGGTVYVTGFSDDEVAGVAVPGYATIAYNAATGAQLWVKRYAPPSGNGAGAFSVAVSPISGTVYVTGYSSLATSGVDYATIAYKASTGAQLWVQRYTGPGNSDDQAESVAVSPAGTTVYVTGSAGGAAATVAYNAATGTQQWAKRYTGTGSANTAASSLAISPTGKTVFITGESYDGSASGEDYATVAYHG